MIRLLLVTPLVTLFVFVGSSSTRAEDTAWPQYGGPNRDFVCAQGASKGVGQRLLWRRALGQGTSGIVSDGKTLFTMYSVTVGKEADKGDEVVVALDRATGKTRWEQRYPVARLKGQETYSGDSIRPQSTPALWKGRLCTLGYTGLLTCFDAVTGKILWRHNLVQEFEATPVQFGFSSSPLPYNGQFIVHVGGKRATLIGFRPEDGIVLWKSDSAEPSYASPIVLRVAGEEHLVQVTRDAIVGVAAKDGSPRWRYPMPKPGLTNVPTPIALSEGRLLVAGQGILGVRLLKIARAADGFQAAEVWKNERVKFFYSNWAADADVVYGCVNEFISAIDLTTGAELWRKRGQSEGNLLRIGAKSVILRGDGLLTSCLLTRTGLTTKGTFAALTGRSWTPPTLLGDTLFVRNETEIAAVGLSSLIRK